MPRAVAGRPAEWDDRLSLLWVATAPGSGTEGAAPMTYPARKAAERQKSYARQVWETIAITLGLGLIIGCAEYWGELLNGCR